jgi:hypothetical protein
MSEFIMLVDIEHNLGLTPNDANEVPTDSFNLNRVIS